MLDFSANINATNQIINKHRNSRWLVVNIQIIWDWLSTLKYSIKNLNKL